MRLRPGGLVSGAGNDRPIDQREESNSSRPMIDPDRLARFKRGALAQESVNPVRPDLLIKSASLSAGNHIGKMGFQRGARRERVGNWIREGPRTSERGRECDPNGAGDDHAGHQAAMRNEPAQAAREPEHHQGVEQEQQQRKRKHRSAQIDWLGGAKVYQSRALSGCEIDRQ